MNIKKINLENLIMACMVISTLAFHDVTIMMVVFELLAIGYQIKKRNGKIDLTNLLKKYLLWEIAFVAFCILSFIWALNTDTLFNCVLSIIQVVICGTAIILYCDTEEKKEKIVKYIMLASSILIARLLIVVPFEAWGEKTRIGQYLGSGSSGGYGNTGLTYVLSIGAIFVLNQGIKSKSRWYYVLFVIFTLFSMLSGSKKAIIIFVMTILVAVIGMIIGLYNGSTGSEIIMGLARSAIQAYFLSIALGLSMMFLEKKPIKKMIKGLITYPIFLFTWLLINAKCLVKRQTVWEKIEHVRSIKIGDVVLK